MSSPAPVTKAALPRAALMGDAKDMAPEQGKLGLRTLSPSQALFSLKIHVERNVRAVDVPSR
jgi:hypothetical protein